MKIPAYEAIVTPRNIKTRRSGRARSVESACSSAECTPVPDREVSVAACDVPSIAGLQSHLVGTEDLMAKGNVDGKGGVRGPNKGPSSGGKGPDSGGKGARGKPSYSSKPSGHRRTNAPKRP